jgi:SNF family Na+-dependent transporter
VGRLLLCYKILSNKERPIEQFYLALTKWVASTADHFWSSMPLLLLAVGLRLMIKTDFIQSRRLRRSSQFFRDRQADFSAPPFRVILYFLVAIVITTFINSEGVKGGQERWTNGPMPLLPILSLFLAIRALNFLGAGKGVSFYLKRDFSDSNTPAAVILILIFIKTIAG